MTESAAAEVEQRQGARERERKADKNLQLVTSHALSPATPSLLSVSVRSHHLRLKKKQEMRDEKSNQSLKLIK